MWVEGLRIRKCVSFSFIQSNQWWWIRKMVRFLSWRWWNTSHILSNHGSFAQISSLQVDEAWGLPKNQILSPLRYENFSYPVLDFWELDVSRPMMGVSGPQILSNQIMGSLPSYHINFSHNAASNHIKSRGQATREMRVSSYWCERIVPCLDVIRGHSFSTLMWCKRNVQKFPVIWFRH